MTVCLFTILAADVAVEPGNIVIVGIVHVDESVEGVENVKGVKTVEGVEIRRPAF